MHPLQGAVRSRSDVSDPPAGSCGLMVVRNGPIRPVSIKSLGLIDTGLLTYWVFLLHCFLNKRSTCVWTRKGYVASHWSPLPA